MYTNLLILWTVIGMTRNAFIFLLTSRYEETAELLGELQGEITERLKHIVDMACEEAVPSEVAEYVNDFLFICSCALTDCQTVPSRCGEEDAPEEFNVTKEISLGRIFGSFPDLWIGLVAMMASSPKVSDQVLNQCLRDLSEYSSSVVKEGACKEFAATEHVDQDEDLKKRIVEGDKRLTKLIESKKYLDVASRRPIFKERRCLDRRFDGDRGFRTRDFGSEDEDGGGGFGGFFLFGFGGFRKGLKGGGKKKKKGSGLDLKTLNATEYEDVEWLSSYKRNPTWPKWVNDYESAFMKALGLAKKRSASGTPKRKKKKNDEDDEDDEENEEEKSTDVKDGKTEVEDSAKKRPKTVVSGDDEQKIADYMTKEKMEVPTKPNGKLSLTIPTLKSVCHKLNLHVSGTKGELVARIVAKLPIETTTTSTSSTVSKAESE
jgi:hypothetical protein